MTIREEFEKRNKISKKYIDKNLVNRLIAYVIVFSQCLASSSTIYHKVRLGLSGH